MPSGDFENRVKVTKIESVLSLCLIMYLCKLGQNPSIPLSLGDKLQTEYNTNAAGSAQKNMSPGTPTPPTNGGWHESTYQLPFTLTALLPVA